MNALCPYKNNLFDRWTQFIWFHITQTALFVFIEMYLDI